MTATVASVNVALELQEYRVRHWLARHQYNRPNEKALRCSTNHCRRLAEEDRTKCAPCLKRQREERLERKKRGRRGVGHV